MVDILNQLMDFIDQETSPSGTTESTARFARVRWEECTPVGVIQPVCSAGYAVTSEDVRKVLEICSASTLAGHVGSGKSSQGPSNVSSNMAWEIP